MVVKIFSVKNFTNKVGIYCYIVPVHFGQDVIEGLATGKMNTATQNGFLSGVASHVFQLKRKPSTEDLINVSQAMITKYPFMRSLTGSPYVSIFKDSYITEFRRPDM